MKGIVWGILGIVKRLMLFLDNKLFQIVYCPYRGTARTGVAVPVRGGGSASARRTANDWAFLWGKGVLSIF